MYASVTDHHQIVLKDANMTRFFITFD